MDSTHQNTSINAGIDRLKQKIGQIGLDQNTNKTIVRFINSLKKELVENVDASLNKSHNNRHSTNIKKYRLIANNLTDIFFILDKDLKFTFLAPSIERVLQYRYTELVGREFDVLVPEWSGNTLAKNLDSVKRLEPDMSNPPKFTIQLSGKYGHLNWYEVQVTGMFDNKSALKGYNGVGRNVTERLKHEEALQLAKRKAEESDNLKSAFLANMSHEIRTPLNGIIGFSSLLNNKQLPEEKKERYAEYIISSSKQLLSLISDIIDISKIEASQLSLFKTQVNLKNVLNELRDTNTFEEERLQKDQVELVLSTPNFDGLTIMTDEIRLKQVLINLLSNAFKFTSKGTVEFGYKIQDDKDIRFFVKDSGTGISINLQRAIFERFRQGDVDRQAQIAGTGLGLAISKGLVELLGGIIGVKSQEGIGSEFYFVLPFKKEKIEKL